MRTNCNNWLGIPCDMFHRSGIHDPLCCNARNQGSNLQPVPLKSHVIYLVTLVRNEAIGPRTWEHSTKASAMARAHSLCHLHSVPEAQWNDRTRTFTVDASAYYADAKPLDPNAPRSHRRKV